MRNALLSSSAAGMWVAFSVACLAQTRSFPAPPPLPSLAPSTGSSGDTSPNVPAPPTSAPSPGNLSPLTPSNQVSDVPAIASAATLNTMSSLDDKNTLKPGDRISYRVIEDRDEAVSLVVTDSGEINIPYLGRFQIAGMTCHEAAFKLKTLLEKDLYKRATVIIGLDVIAGSNQDVIQDVVWLVGQVRGVGPQPINKLQPLTVSQVILKAGGFGDFADQRRVRLIHRTPRSGGDAGAPTATEVADGTGQVIDVKAVYAGQRVPDPVVQPNDMIIVPKKLVNF